MNNYAKYAQIIFIFNQLYLVSRIIVLKVLFHWTKAASRNNVIGIAKLVLKMNIIVANHAKAESINPYNKLFILFLDYYLTNNVMINVRIIPLLLLEYVSYVILTVKLAFLTHIV